jgi:sugar lactone lactonase YvrE
MLHLLPVAFLAPLVAAPATDQLFARPPQATRAGDQVTVAFALSRSTDVEVAVLNAKGEVIRHLAAGVLGGKNPPPAPLKAGLEQQLTWDGKDDAGKPAVGGPFQARVRAGMTARFGRMIGGSPYTGSVVTMPYRAPVNGLAVDGQGKLFVLMMSSVGSHGNSGMWPWHLRQFDRDGNYLRTVLPYPPSTDPAKAHGFQLLGTPEKQFTPANQTSLYPVFSVLGNEMVSRLADGQIVFVHSEARTLNFLATDGSNRLRSLPMWSDKAKLHCPGWLDIQVALAPDGRWAYYANVAGTAYDGKTPADIDARWPQGRIYRQDLTKPDSDPAPFFDLELPAWDKEKYWMPSAWDKKTAAAGIDTDARGNVLVCDLVNQQVVEISPEGKRLSATKVPWPDKVLVSRKTGALYVISRKVSRGYLPPATLSKIAGRGDTARVVSELSLAGTIGGGYTLDESGKNPVLWLAGQDKETESDTSKLIRVEDQGAKLAVTGDQFLNRDGKAITFVGYMDVDTEAELVYVTRSGGTVWRYHGATGEGGPLEIKAVDLAIGPGGMIYTWGTSGSYEGAIARYTRDLKPAPLPATGKHTFGYVYGRAGRGSSVCGLDVDARGRVYATYGTNECHVRVYDDKGELVDFARKEKVSDGRGEPKEVPVAISGVSGCGGSLRVDRAGYLYLLQAGVPKDYAAPPGYEKDEAYRNAVGTIYKFPPSGGVVRARNDGAQIVEGAVAVYPGCGPVSRWRAVGSCVCTKPRFDVDDFGRLYIPNGITFSVSVRDNADNEIMHFGGYGNFDCQGPDSKEPRPTIPLGWPVTAGASDRYIYVGDCLNHRVVRVDKRYTAESVVKIME